MYVRGTMRCSRFLMLCIAISSCGRSVTGPGVPDYKTSMAEMQARQVSIKAEMQKNERNCPWPADGNFGHTARVVDTSRPVVGLPPDIAKLWADGCAVIRFGIDADGVPTHATVVIATPPATAPAALSVVQQNVFARGDSPDGHYYIRIGLSHPATGGYSVSSMLR